MPAYVEMVGRSWRETLPICSAATIGDVFVTFAIYGAVALASSSWLGWGLSGNWVPFAAAAVLGAVTAAGIEWYATGTSRWSYTPRMPLLPLNLGVWPILQLTVLVPLSVALARLLSRRACGPEARHGPHSE